VLLSFISIFAGFVIYILFRENDISILGHFYIISPAYFKENTLMSFLIFNMPDGLWFLSGILIIHSIWIDSKKTCFLYIFLFLVVSVLFECLQLVPGIKGTFDIADISLILFIAIIYCITQSILWGVQDEQASSS
jgi:hypothetical protein